MTRLKWDCGCLIQWLFRKQSLMLFVKLNILGNALDELWHLSFLFHFIIKAILLLWPYFARVMNDWFRLNSFCLLRNECRGSSTTYKTLYFHYIIWLFPQVEIILVRVLCLCHVRYPCCLRSLSIMNILISFLCSHYCYLTLDLGAYSPVIELLILSLVA